LSGKAEIEISLSQDVAAFHKLFERRNATKTRPTLPCTPLKQISRTGDKFALLASEHLFPDPFERLTVGVGQDD